MKHLRLFALLAITFFSSTACFSQLTDFTPSYHLESDSLSTDSLLYVSITFNDISDFGGIQVSVYDSESGTFLMEFQGIREEMLTSGALTATELTISLVQIEEGKQYRLDINPYTLGGSFLEHEVITTTL